MCIRDSTWGAVDFKRGTITINQQLARPEHRGATPFISPKNGKSRTITPAASVMTTLKQQKRRQMEQQLKAGPLWDSQYHVVFSTEIGEPLDQWKVEKCFSTVLKIAGLSLPLLSNTKIH